jgi:hypothetical protein
MRKNIRKQIVFVSQSMVWASLLFATVMVLLNWNEMKASITGRYVIITNERDTIIRKVDMPDLSPISSLFSKVHTLLKAVSMVRL